MVAMTVFEAVLITDTVPAPRLTTHAKLGKISGGHLIIKCKSG